MPLRLGEMYRASPAQLARRWSSARLWCTVFMAAMSVRSICAVPTFEVDLSVPMCCPRVCRVKQSVGFPSMSGDSPLGRSRAAGPSAHFGTPNHCIQLITAKEESMRERVRCNNLAAIVDCRVESRAVIVLRYHLS